MATRGGLLLRIDGAPRFLPASVALRVAPAPALTAVPGAPADLLGIAMHEGTVVPVLAVGAARAEMVVCRHAGELVGLVGCTDVRAGVFEDVPGDDEAVLVDGQRVPAVDVEAVYERVRASRGGIKVLP